MTFPESCPELSMLLDYLDGTLSQDEEGFLRQHLGQTCVNCEENLELLRWTIESGATPLENPPPETLEMAKAIAAYEPPGELELIYDSALEPLAAGVRSLVTESRRLVWRISGFEIELQVEVLKDQRLALVGEIRAVNGKNRVADLEVILVSEEHDDLQVRTDEHGQFLIESPAADPRRLVVRRDQAQEFEILLDLR